MFVWLLYIFCLKKNLDKKHTLETIVVSCLQCFLNLFFVWLLILYTCIFIFYEYSANYWTIFAIKKEKTGMLEIYFFFLVLNKYVYISCVNLHSVYTPVYVNGFFYSSGNNKWSPKLSATNTKLLLWKSELHVS